MSTPKTPVRIAVEPLLSQAEDAAFMSATNIINKVMEDLESHGWDINACAPWPSSVGIRLGHPDYVGMKSKHTLYHSLVQLVSSTYQPGRPEIVKRDPDRQKRFIDEARRNAAFQYEAFIIKLENKIGGHSDAILKGSHIWDYSILEVTTPEGIEYWKTHTIINVSKLGKIFNQYPTRKVKA